MGVSVRVCVSLLSVIMSSPFHYRSAWKEKVWNLSDFPSFKHTGSVKVFHQRHWIKQLCFSPLCSGDTYIHPLTHTHHWCFVVKRKRVGGRVTDWESKQELERCSKASGIWFMWSVSEGETNIADIAHHVLCREDSIVYCTLLCFII